MPYPVASVPIPQAGMNIPMSQQLAYPLGMLLGGILPMLLGKKKDENQTQSLTTDQTSSPSAAPTAVTPDSPVSQAGMQQAQQAMQGSQPQPQQPDMNAQLQRAAQTIQGGMGGIGGLGGMAGAGNGTSPMGMASAMPGTQVQPQQGFHISPPSYAGTGPNAAMLQNYGLSGNMAPNVGGVSGPAGLNPLAQYQRRLAMLNLLGGGGNNGNNGSMTG